MKSYISHSKCVNNALYHKLGFRNDTTFPAGTKPCKEKRKCDKSSGYLLKYRWSGGGIE